MKIVLSPKVSHIFVPASVKVVVIKHFRNPVGKSKVQSSEDVESGSKLLAWWASQEPIGVFNLFSILRQSNWVQLLISLAGMRHVYTIHLTLKLVWSSIYLVLLQVPTSYKAGPGKRLVLLQVIPGYSDASIDTRVGMYMIQMVVWTMSQCWVVCSFEHTSWVLVLKAFKFGHWVCMNMSIQILLKCTCQVSLYKNLHVLGRRGVGGSWVWTWINNNLIRVGMKHASGCWEYSCWDKCGQLQHGSKAIA